MTSNHRTQIVNELEIELCYNATLSIVWTVSHCKPGEVREQFTSPAVSVGGGAGGLGKALGSQSVKLDKDKLQPARLAG